MPRVHYLSYVTDSNGIGVDGAIISVSGRNPATPVAVYTASTGATRVATPILTVRGKAEFWVDDNVAYNITTVGSGFQDYTYFFDAVSAETVNTLRAQIALANAFGGFATPTGGPVAFLNNAQTFSRKNTFTPDAGNPAIVSNALITATPGIRFSDGTVQTSAATSGTGGDVFLTRNQTFTGLNTFSTPIWFSSDVNLYRAAANVLQTDDSLIISGGIGNTPALSVTGVITATPGIRFSDGTIQTTAPVTSASGGDVFLAKSQRFVGINTFATPFIAVSPTLTGAPALNTLGLITATPGIRFSDGTIQTSASIYSSVRDYGAVGNNVTDDTAAIQAAIDACSAAGGGIVYVPPATYRIATTINMKSNVTLMGAGFGASILMFDDVALVGIGLNNGAATTASTLLTSNLTEYATPAFVTSTAGFNVGDLVEFTSSNDRYGFWMSKIVDITGLRVTLEEPSPNTLLTSDGALMRKWTMATNVGLRDLAVTNVLATPLLRAQPIWMTRFNRLNIERVLINRSARDIMLIEHGIDLTIRDCEARDCYKQSDSGGTTLGWAIQSTTNVRASGLRSHNCGLGLTLYGCPRSVASDIQAINSTQIGSRGIKVEAASNYTTVSNCVVSNIDQTHDGYHISDSWGVVFTGITADNCGESCSLTETIAGRMHDIEVSNFSFRNTTEPPGGAYGIRVSGVVALSELDRLVFGPGLIADTKGHAISIAGGTNWLITGVVISRATKSGIALTPATPVDFWGKISDCVFDGIGTSGSDACIFIQNSNRVAVSDCMMHNYFASASGISISATGNSTNNQFSNIMIDNAGGGSPYQNLGTGANVLTDFNWVAEFPTFGVNDIVTMPPKQVTVTDVATPLIRASRGTYFALSAGASRQMGIPSDPAKGMQITIVVLNNSGGAITTSWPTAYRLAGAWVDPAANKRRTITFAYDGTAWIELGRSAADI